MLLFTTNVSQTSFLSSSLVTPGKLPQPLVGACSLRQLHLVDERRVHPEPVHADDQHHHADRLREQPGAVAAGLHRDDSHLQPVERVAAHPGPPQQLRALAQLLRQHAVMALDSNSPGRHIRLFQREKETPAESLVSQNVVGGPDVGQQSPYNFIFCSFFI